MSFKIPEIGFGGKPVKGSLEQMMSRSTTQATTVTPPVSAPVTTPARNALQLDNYITVPGATHGDYWYPDILVPMERSYLGKDWNQAHEALKAQGAFMLTVRQFNDFIGLIRRGVAHDGNGQPIDSNRLLELYNDITQVRSPYRAEWLDAKFTVKGAGPMGVGAAIGRKEYSITYHTVDANGLIGEITEPIADGTLLSDQTPGIDMDEWLTHSNKHGLPTIPLKDKASGPVYYWYPRDGKVAGFGAGSVGAYLDCYWDPQCSYPELGVRASYAKK